MGDAPLEKNGDLKTTTKDLVFVVDDEREIGELVEAFLQMEGFETLFFENPEQALAAFVDADPRPALLLTDYLMQPYNGLELLEKCKVAQPNLKCILYSGNIDEAGVTNHTIKPDRFLRKPFLSKDLIGMVKHVLDGAL